MVARRTHRWDNDPRIALDVGLAHVNGTNPPCGKKLDNSSTRYPQEAPFSPLIHISAIPENPVHIWGYRFRQILIICVTSPHGEPIIHILARVIHLTVVWTIIN